MLRIAILTYSTNPRGGVVHSLYLGEQLAKLGHQIRIFALDKTDSGGFFRPTTSPFTIIPYGRLPENDLNAKILRYIETYADYFSGRNMDEFDIYHAQDCVSVSGLLKVKERGRKFPLVRTIHHVDDFISPELIKCQQRSIIYPDYHITVSQYWQERVSSEFGINSTLIHNGVDTSRFTPAKKGTNPKERFGFGVKIVFLTIGGIEPRKNTIKLLMAFMQARTRLRRVGREALLVIGGGKTLFDYTAYRNEFFARVEENGLELGKDVVITGVLEEEAVPLLYQSADCFVFPSVKEGWGLVVLEALLSGLPTVVSDITVFHEYLQHRRDALFASPEDPAQFADAMVAAVTNRALRIRLFHGGLATASQFSWESTAVQHVDFYRRVMQNNEQGFLEIKKQANAQQYAKQLVRAGGGADIR